MEREGEAARLKHVVAAPAQRVAAGALRTGAAAAPKRHHNLRVQAAYTWHLKTGVFVQFCPAEAMEIAHGAIEAMGARERHHVVLPSYPNYRVGAWFCDCRWCYH